MVDIMKKFRILFIFLVLFISVSAVYADGNFSSLQTEINDAGNTIEITDDYIYDNSTDYLLNSGIVVNKMGFTINGNGHTINGNGQARIFNVIESITINNLNLINGFSKDAGGAILANDRLHFENVSFENNSAHEGGAVKIDLIEANNCVFNNNHAEKGGAVSYSFHSVITNSIFKNSFNLTYSLIYGGSENSGIRLVNCSFLNSTSKYAAALYNRRDTVIINSTFANLHSSESAGAIYLKEMRHSEINNCTFINTTAIKNGGSIYIDALGDTGFSSDTLISNTAFIDSSANFGGALLYLGSTLTINNSKFINNVATIDGGAIYASKVQANIYNTSILSNVLVNEENNGGGFFFDNCNLNITDSNFISNTKNAIYAYDCNLTINRSNFENNGEAIHGVFLKCEMAQINLNSDLLILNETDFVNRVSKNPINLVLINNSITVDNLPKRFDSRDWGWVSSVKNQIIDGSCWAFGTIAALESALLKSTGIEYDFSENNIKDTMLEYSKYGVFNILGTGYVLYPTQNILSWLGPIFEQNDTFDELAKISPIFFSEDNVHIQDAIFVGPRKNLTDNDEVKKAIMRCGSLAIEYYSSTDEMDYNNKTHAQYQNLLNDRTHIVSVVGWDDNYSKENFITSPPGDGAWILKDSFGLENGDKGFIYLSYYDISFLNSSYAVGFIIENTERYVRNYQTDLSGELIFSQAVGGRDATYKITYESSGSELISGAGTYFKYEGEQYVLNIYVNGVLKHTQNGTGPYYGFHTIKLTDEIPIKKEDNFTVEMTKKYIPILNNSRQHYAADTVFVKNGDVFEDLSLKNQTASLKVYTKDLSIYAEDLVKIYRNDSKFEANIGAVNESVIFEVNGVNYTRVSDENATARIAINLIPGNYTVKTTFNGTTVKNNIEVLPTLIADNLVKYFRNESQFYISLIDAVGNAVPNVNITMNINGVFYNRATNANGTARLNINLEPGEYTLTAIDPVTGLEMSYNITVLPTLIADDMNMAYLDGSQFSAKLLDGGGNPLANVNIEFNINGVFYNRTTNSSGYASLNIRLIPGEYIITSRYENAIISNKITVMAVKD